MPTDRVAPGSRQRAPDRSERTNGRLATTTIVSLCDRLLGEVGRRHHMFSWLRASDSSPGGWLPVDAYYPRNRLVVMCQSHPGRYDSLYHERVTGKGLRFLRIDPAELGTNRTSAESALAGKIFALQRRSREEARRERAAPTPADAPSSSAVLPERADRRPVPASPADGRPADARPADARPADRRPADGPPADLRPDRRPADGPPADLRPDRGPADRRTANGRPAGRSTADYGLADYRRPVRRRERRPLPRALGLAIGVPIGALFAAGLIAELYLALIKVAVQDGRLLLALALALDACSRAVGTVAAERAGERLWAFACAIGGAPFVAAFSVPRRSGRARVEPAPLAAVLSVLACLSALIGLLSGN